MVVVVQSVTAVWRAKTGNHWTLQQAFTINHNARYRFEHRNWPLFLYAEMPRGQTFRPHETKNGLILFYILAARLEGPFQWPFELDISDICNLLVPGSSNCIRIRTTRPIFYRSRINIVNVPNLNLHDIILHCVACFFARNQIWHVLLNQQ